MENESSPKDKKSPSRKQTLKRKGSRPRQRRWKDVLDRWLFLQMVAIFSFSFGVGMLFMHASILWHQYKHGYGYWAEYNSMEEVLKERVLSRLAAAPHIYQWSQGQLRVNTTLFVH